LVFNSLEFNTNMKDPAIIRMITIEKICSTDSFKCAKLIDTANIMEKMNGPQSS
jgi:hypothetical protein